jgi:polyhydroxybutyrate depolymerase
MGCASATGARARGELSKHSIIVGNRERSYLLYTPATAGSDRDLRPLVLVFHGGGGTARGIAREVGRSMHGIADREGFYVAYPNAVDKIWDFGAGTISESLDVRIDDRAYFAALLDELTSTAPIDQRRIFATGISRGGQASYFVACVYPDRIRAIAPVAMPMPVFMIDLCPDAKNIGVAIFNGTEDPLVPYQGGQITVGRRERGEVMSTAETIDFWRRRNNCTAEPTAEAVLDPTRDRMRVIKTSWENCEFDPVLLYRIEGGGHTWPSGSQYLPRFLVGPVNRDIDAATEIWQFFARFR